jgi:FkbM family methyltransferase
MDLARKLRRRFELVTHTRIYRRAPRGIDLAYDLAQSLPKYRVQAVFDVGANVGQSTQTYLENFPEARIYCFEPVQDTFRRLEHNVQGRDRVQCFRLAFGSAKQRGTMVLQRSSVMAFLADESKPWPDAEPAATETVDVVTLDDFCGTRGIDRIGYLKIDTEGGDAEVLKGAENLLGEQRIDLVQLEAGMNPMNTWHVPLETLKRHLESRKYFLFGLYEQIPEWPTREPHLRRANPLFISRRMIDAHSD